MSNFHQNNLFNLLVEASEKKPESDFFVYKGKGFCYKDVLLGARRLASCFRKMGIEKGDRVLLYLGNVPEFIYSVFAILQLGACAVLVNPVARKYELEYYIKETMPGAAVASSSQLDYLMGEKGPLLPPENILLTDARTDKNFFWSVMDGEGPLEDISHNDPSAPAVIIYTSAMDGNPLGAMIEHFAIYETARLTSNMIVNENDVFLTVIPLFHSFGLTSSLFTPLLNMVPLYLVNRFSPKNIYKILSNDSITVFCGVPVMYMYMKTAIPEGAVFPGMRAWISGGEKIVEELQEEYLNKYNVEIRQGYGLTEASPIVTWNSIPGPNRFGSIGKPMPYNEVVIRKDGREAGPGEDGEILVKGVNVIKGYYKREDRYRETVKDGWLHTGDIGRMDEDGYYYITGRKKNMVLKLGFNVYPMEVEKILKNHPDVSDVRITGRIEKIDEATHAESLEALVYRKKGRQVSEESFGKWCKENISIYKVPDKIEIR